jgi:predicted metal-dependent hydrolase
MTDPLPASLHPQARRGIDLFNRGEYFKAHESLELAWLDTKSPERNLYQGILQIGLAYYQISRGNFRGALKMFKRGQRNLGHLGESMLGIDIVQFQKDAYVVEERLKEMGYSRIELLDNSIYKPVPLIEY